MGSAVCNIPAGSPKAILLQRTAAIIVDEAAMLHKACFETVNRTLQDIMQNKLLFGGIPMLIAGDFRQIPPVVRGGTPGDIINASLKSSFLWDHVTQLRLTTNMRAFMSNDPNAQDFADLLLDVGNGRIPVVEAPDTIEIPQGLGHVVQSFEDLKEAVYTGLAENYTNQEWFAERNILSPLRTMVNKANTLLTEELPGNARHYFSINSAQNDDDAVLYPREFLDSRRRPRPCGASLLLCSSYNPYEADCPFGAMLQRLY